MRKPIDQSVLGRRRAEAEGAALRVADMSKADASPMRWRVNTSETKHVEFRETWQAIGFAVGMLLNDMRRVNVTVLDLTRHCDWYVHRVGADQVEFRVEPKPCHSITTREAGPRRYASRRKGFHVEE